MDIMTGDELFEFEGFPISKSLSDFWAWHSSDLLNNTLRGALAEFIIAISLDIDTNAPREDWTSYDLLWKDIRIEVKSAAYLQSWEQREHSKIRFSIAPSREWSPETSYGTEITRHSDVYVFCLYSCKDKATSNPMLLDHWNFFVISTNRLNQLFPSQRSISLATLESADPIACDFYGINTAIKKALCR